MMQKQSYTNKKRRNVMACYTVNLVSVEFKVGYKNILLAALNKLNWDFKETIYGVYIPVIDAKLYLAEEKVKMPDSTNNRSELNKLKVAYSETIIDLVAKKRRWVKKEISQGRYQLTKY
jgi:hypothetical protein